MTEPEFQTYLCEYGHDGARWSVEVKATSFEDAQARMRAMAFGVVNGPIVLGVSIPFGALLERLFFRRGQ